MSIRAYKLIEIKTAPSPTFNCWRDQDIFDLAEIDQYNENGGIITFDKEVIQEELDNRLNGINKAETNEEQQDIINKLIQIIKEMDGENYIDYYCY